MRIAGWSSDPRGVDLWSRPLHTVTGPGSFSDRTSDKGRANGGPEGDISLGRVARASCHDMT